MPTSVDKIDQIRREREGRVLGVIYTFVLHTYVARFVSDS